MIVSRSGNLLDDDAEALVNAVNTVGVSGKGLALAFRRRFPLSEAAYRAAASRGEVRLGSVLGVPADGCLDGPKWVVHFPTKGHWREPSRIEWIEAGLDDLVRFLREHHVRSVAVPALGCGCGGLSWGRVESVIRARLGSLEDVEVRLYGPGAPAGAPG